jgi:hypothetical protein
VGFGMFGLWVRRLLDQRGGIGTASAGKPAIPPRVAPSAIASAAHCGGTD